MKILFLMAVVWRLVIMPTGAKSDLSKPFDVPKTFSSETDCRADAASNLQSYLVSHGLTSSSTANFACTPN